MTLFHYLEAATKPAALGMMDSTPSAKFLAGGNTLLALMKLGVETLHSPDVPHDGRVQLRTDCEHQGCAQPDAGMTFGIGMALLEELVYDQNAGRAVNADLADYMVPVNTDVPRLKVEFVGDPDVNFNPLGVRGVGEIGNTGSAAAIANAVFHATGKRVRKLPILVESIL